MTLLKPFWQYYGGKWRAAPRYPKPKFNTIIEPFAGSAGYAMRYPDKNIILIEKYHVVAEIWRWLIAAKSAEVLSIPLVENVDSIPTNIAQGAKWLIGFMMNSATTHPCKTLSAGKRKLIATGHSRHEGWSEARRLRVANQVALIKHWQIIEGDYTQAPDIEATWFVDPPYNNKPGGRYASQVSNYEDLANWCQDRKGQTIVCENEGANWLPFTTFETFKAGVNGKGSREVIWTNE